ncbi:CPBP family intramembrane metalloprotease [Neobacillus sp. MM2021_6]|uniref:CPBP family intramembrane glutamic endopeptidase n=1 Tax=Bacillaceae TaxID=186817 RepID=UPI001409C687|nr:MULTISPECIES: CPBP family intramembrane glutamic endopeptidase [Bacillaceae]MBO0962264.1 CPBP family intramembrane metalloprotease [Neobacillus sp. MM2021_6]NHC19413.1 CPBP family intramembrane metalloprotease [Bacillus sp. MM2020_4]
MSYYGKVLTGFIVLDLYLNIGIAKAGQFWLQVLLVLLFFPLLKGILMLTKANEYKNIGITFHPKWSKNMMLGFIIGFSFWLVKYAMQYLLHGFDITGIVPFPQMLSTLFMIMLTFLIGSCLNDIIIRGYVFGHLKGKMPMKWVFLISLVLYVLDDSWNEGFSLSNTLFSLVLGLSVTYAIYKTGSIWANTGIHWGLNVCYGIFNGTLGSSGGGILLTQDLSTTFMTEIISYMIPLFMFLFIFLMRNKFAKIG